MSKVFKMSARWRSSRLHRAAEFGKVKAVRVLLGSGSDPNNPDSNGRTALHRAVENGHKEIVTMLVSVTDINISDHAQWTALHCAADKGHDGLIQILLEAGAFVDAIDIHGHTPLLLAASRGNVQAVKILIDAKANVSAQDRDENTALHLAVASGVAEVVELLLSEGAGADIAKVNKRGEMPEELAINEGYWGILNKLKNAQSRREYR